MIIPHRRHRDVIVVRRTASVPGIARVLGRAWVPERVRVPGIAIVPGIASVPGTASVPEIASVPGTASVPAELAIGPYTILIDVAASLHRRKKGNAWGLYGFVGEDFFD